MRYSHCKRLPNFFLLALPALLLAAFSAAPAQAEVASNTTVFPPTNQAAGSGLLYFPQGGNASLFAVPVLSDPAIINALNAQTVAIQAQTEAIKGASQNGRYQISCYAYGDGPGHQNTGGQGCTTIDTRTGALQ